MSGEGDELPLTVVKSKLSDIIDETAVSIHREALLALSESAKIFIHYLSVTYAFPLLPQFLSIFRIQSLTLHHCCFGRSNDICREANRKTIKAEDVLKALEELEFPELLDPLRTSLTGGVLFSNSVCHDRGYWPHSVSVFHFWILVDHWCHDWCNNQWSCCRFNRPKRGVESSFSFLYRWVAFHYNLKGCIGTRYWKIVCGIWGWPYFLYGKLFARAMKDATFNQFKKTLDKRWNDQDDL